MIEDILNKLNKQQQIDLFKTIREYIICDMSGMGLCETQKKQKLYYKLMTDYQVTEGEIYDLYDYITNEDIRTIKKRTI